MSSAAHQTKEYGVNEVVDFVQGLQKRVGLFAAIVHLSQLRPYNRPLYKIRGAVTVLKQFMGIRSHKIFLLDTQDIVLVSEGPESFFEHTLMRLKRYFSTDPLTAAMLGQERFYTLYNLGSQVPDLVSALHDLTLPPPQEGVSENTKPKSPKKNAINVEKLTDVYNMLKSADLMGLVRRQAIYWHESPEYGQPVSYEYFVGIQKLQEAVCPNMDIRADYWLFRHLTKKLDQRLLEGIVDAIREETLSRFHMNMNIESIDTDEFQSFCKKIDNSTKEVIFEFDQIDFYANPDSFFNACDIMRSHGFKVFLDGINHHTLSIIENPSLNIDGVKICWSPMLREPMTEYVLKDLVDQFGPEKVILQHCDAPGVIAFGLKNGINMFQGFALDALHQKKD